MATEGILYDRETILGYILKEKQRIAEETAKFHSAHSREAMLDKKRKAVETDEAVRKFEETECGLLPMKKSKVGCTPYGISSCAISWCAARIVEGS